MATTIALSARPLSQPVLVLGSGPGSTLLTGPGAARWRDVAAVVRPLGVSLVHRTLGGPGLQDRDGILLDRYGLESSGAVLVRPDGYVAWRSASAIDDVAETFHGNFTRLLHVPETAEVGR